MAGLWCDNWTAYLSSADLLNGVYAQVDGAGGSGGISISTANPPRAGSKHLRFDHNHFSGAGPVLRRIFGAPKVSVGVGWRLWTPNLPVVETIGQTLIPFSFQNGANQTQVQVVIGTDGSLVLYSGQVGFTPPVLLHRSLPCIQSNAYNQLEAKAVIDAVAGAVEVRVNGVTKINYAGQTLFNGGAETSQVIMQGPGGGAGVSFMDMADLHAWDTNVGEGPVDFVGNVGVLARPLIADTAIADMTPSAGPPTYPLLQDQSDGTFIEADTVGLKSAFLAQALPAGTVGIVYQQLMFRGLKTDAGDCDINASFITPQISGWDETMTGDQPMTTAETWRWGIVGNDPGTGVPWTYDGVTNSYGAVTRTL